GGRARPHPRVVHRRSRRYRRLHRGPLSQRQLRGRTAGQQLGDAATGHAAGLEAGLRLALSLASLASSGSRRRAEPRPTRHAGTLMTTPLLELRDITLGFRGLVALANVGFALSEGEVTALIGPNGAGKTSVFNVICGFYKPQGGDVLWRGERITGAPPQR